MDTRAPLTASLLIIAGMMAVSLWIWPQIPDSVPVVVHWDIDGKPNGFAPKLLALLIAPAGALFLTVIFAGLSRKAPKGIGFQAVWIGIILLLAVAHAITVLVAHGAQIDVTAKIVFAVSILLLVVGNFLGKTEPNPYLGVRTKWTYESGYSWEKTNRMGGRLFVAVGLLTLASLAIAEARIAFWVMMSGVLLTAAICIPISYYYWKHDPEPRIDRS